MRTRIFLKHLPDQDLIVLTPNEHLDVLGLMFLTCGVNVDPKDLRF